MMKVMYVGQSDPGYFINGKIYTVIDWEHEDLYRIIDETGEDFLYSIDENFKIIENNRSFDQPKY